MIIPKVICQLCGQEISKSNYSKHLRRHEQHPETFRETYKADSSSLSCKFCNKLCKSNNSRVQHELRCKSNPNCLSSVIVDGFNTVGRDAWNKGQTKEENASVMRQSESLHNYYINNPNVNFGGYVPTSARKCKYGTYKGFYCDSGWELAFLIYHLDKGSTIKRCTQSFDYTYQEKSFKYYPDFIIDNIYYEIKGIYREEDPEKIKQFPSDKTLVVIDSNNIYQYIKYCEKTYGKDYTKLYDREYPSWLDRTDPEKHYNFNISYDA